MAGHIPHLAEEVPQDAEAARGGQVGSDLSLRECLGLWRQCRRGGRYSGRGTE
jgi:hypothetical protein